MTDAVSPGPAAAGLKSWHKGLIWIGVVGGAIGAAYLTGRLQTASKIEAADQRTQEMTQKSETHLRELKAEHAEVQRLEARRRLHLVLLELDARNFGVAEEHLASSVRSLRQGAGDPGSELGKLADEMGKYRLHATENAGDQRAAVLGWVKRFDKLVPPSP